MKRFVVSTMVMCAFVWVGTAPALEPAVKCESLKNKTAGKYAACLQKAVAFLVKRPTETVKYNEKVAKCNDKFRVKWDKAEVKGEGLCPDEPLDPNSLAGFIAEHSDAVAAALAGPDTNTAVSGSAGTSTSVSAPLGMVLVMTLPVRVVSSLVVKEASVATGASLTGSTVMVTVAVSVSGVVGSSSVTV